MSRRKYLDAETLKQHLFMEAALGYIKTLADVNRVIDALPEAEPCLNWHPASEIPLLHHEVDENKCEGIRGTTQGQEGRAKARSKTAPGIAKAMSEQWG